MNLINTLRGGHCFGSSRTRRITGGKSPRLNWATQFLDVAYDGAYYPTVSVGMVWISFSALPCRKKKLMAAHVSMLLKSRTSPDMLPFSFVTRKYLQFGTWKPPLSNDTIDSVLRLREVGRAKDLSARLVICCSLCQEKVGSPRPLNSLLLVNGTITIFYGLIVIWVPSQHGCSVLRSCWKSSETVFGNFLLFRIAVSSAYPSL